MKSLYLTPGSKLVVPSSNFTETKLKNDANFRTFIQKSDPVKFQTGDISV